MSNIRIKLEMDNLLLQAVVLTVASKQSHLDIAELSSINDLLNNLGLSKSMIGFASVNGQWEGLDYILQDNDTVALFPCIIGG